MGRGSVAKQEELGETQPARKPQHSGIRKKLFHFYWWLWDFFFSGHNLFSHDQ